MRTKTGQNPFSEAANNTASLPSSSSSFRFWHMFSIDYGRQGNPFEIEVTLTVGTWCFSLSRHIAGLSTSFISRPIPDSYSLSGSSQ